MEEKPRWRIGILSDAAGFNEARDIFLEEPLRDIEEVKRILASRLPDGFVAVVVDDGETGQRHALGEPGSFKKWLDLMG